MFRCDSAQAQSGQAQTGSRSLPGDGLSVSRRQGDTLHHLLPPMPRMHNVIPHRRDENAEVEIHRLQSCDRDRMLEFYLGLDGPDRRCRFHMPISDTHIKRYISGIDFEKVIVMACVNRQGHIVASAEVALGPDGWEVGIVVGSQWRRSGKARTLMSAAVDEAFLSGARQIYADYEIGNKAMIGLLRSMNWKIGVGRGRLCTGAQLTPMAA